MPSPSERSPQRGVVQPPERKPPRRTARKPARKPPRTARPRRWPVVLLRLLAAAAVVGVLLFMYLDAYIQREFSGKKWAVPAMVYGRPLELYAGAPVGPRALTAELETLGYRAAGATAGAGTYSVSGGTVSIATRGFRFWDGEEPPRRLRVAVRRQLGADGPRRTGHRSGAGAARARAHRRHLSGAQRGPHPGAGVAMCRRC